MKSKKPSGEELVARREPAGEMVLGVDPGTRCMGFALLVPGARPRLWDYGTVRSGTGDSHAERLLKIHRSLEEIIARHRPSVVAVEDVFCGKNIRSALRVGEARGVALLAGAAAGLPVVEYAPATIKKAVTGNGRADKRQVQRMITRLLGLQEPPEPLDASDAIAVAYCHAQRVGHKYSLQEAPLSIKNSPGVAGKVNKGKRE